MKALLSLTILAFLFVGCSEDDDSGPSTPTGPKPTISLIGDSRDTVTLNTSYTDQGATATDANGNDISSSIKTSGSVNINLAGIYKITYSVIDGSGVPATPVSRDVLVKNDADYLDGVYLAKQYCGSSSNTKPDFTTTIISSKSVNNRIFFSKLQPINDTVEANIFGTSLVVSSGTSSGVNYSGGTGSIDAQEIKAPISTGLSGYMNCIVTIER